MEIVKVNPEEFGLDVEKASKIESSFAPVIVEREGLISVYEGILNLEINPETCKQAKELRLKLVKLRTSTDRIHKAEKAFFLAAGRFVDAWKNKTNTTIEEMESRLSEIENYYVILEQKRIAELETERTKQVAELSDVIPSGLGKMEKGVFDAYLQGLKVAKEAREKAIIEAEKEREMLAEIQRLHNERKDVLLSFWQFLTVEEKAANLGYFEVVEFENLLSACKSRKADADKKQIELEAERKRLAAENEKRQKELEAERAKAEKERKEAEAERLRIEAENQKKLEAERAEKQRIQTELDNQRKAENERIEAEKAAKAKAEMEAKKAAKAPDKDKIIKYIESLSFESLQLSTMEGATVAADISAKFESFKKWAVNEANKL
jgi:hypothetical protein